MTEQEWLLIAAQAAQPMFWFPPPLWGRVRVGGRECRALVVLFMLETRMARSILPRVAPPTLTLG
jgi:hypothetical protein